MKPYVIHHVAEVTAEHLDPTNHPVIYWVVAYSDHPFLYGFVEPLAKAEGYLVDFDLEGLAELSIAAGVDWTAVVTLAGRFDCMAGKHCFLVLEIPFDFVASIRLIFYLLEVVGLEVDPSNLAYIHQTRPDFVLAYLSSRTI